MRTGGLVYQYVLPPHVYACLTRDGAVFLDLKCDKYFGISDSVVRMLELSVLGWPRRTDRPSTSELPLDQRVQSTTEALLNKGLLTRNIEQGKSAAPINLDRPEHTVIEFDPDDAVSVRTRHALRFLAAYFTARVQIRLFSIQCIVHHARYRKQRRMASAACIDPKRVRELMKVFIRLRALLYTSRDACLLDSLVAIEFLARYGLFPTWVFGVKTGPFEAHSWLQHEATVLNDTPERARAYTPILAV